MIPYVGCEHARELLEAFLDGELSVTDQVAVESHLRWCRTCTAHVDDLRLLGGTVRSVPVACPRPNGGARTGGSRRRGWKRKPSDRPGLARALEPVA